MPEDVLTVPQLAEELTRQTETLVPDWKARRVVDALAPNLPRVVNYRLIPRTMVPAIIQELTRQGWFDRGTAPCE
jgi:hypothetical protein